MTARTSAAFPDCQSYMMQIHKQTTKQPSNQATKQPSKQPTDQQTSKQTNTQTTATTTTTTLTVTLTMNRNIIGTYSLFASSRRRTQVCQAHLRHLRGRNTSPEPSRTIPT